MRNKYFYLSIVCAVIVSFIPAVGVFNLGLGEDLLSQTIIDRMNAESELTKEFPKAAIVNPQQEIITSQVESIETSEVDTSEFISPSVIVEYTNTEETLNLVKDVQQVTGASEEEARSALVETKDNTMIVNLGDKEKAMELIKTASDNQTVKSIQPIYTYKTFYTPTNDPEWGNQWYYQDQPSGINAESGWDTLGDIQGVGCSEFGTGKACGGDPSVKIAVIDTGVNTSTSDLSGANIDTANSMRFYNNNDNTCSPGTYYVGFQNSTPPPAVINFCQDIGSQFDEQGHGTGVTSLIHAQDNSTGAVGLAHNTTLLPIAVHGDAFNTYFIAEAVSYAVDNGADVINLSLGTPFFDSYLESAINDAVNNGAIVVAASGNCAVWSTSCDWDGNGTQTAGFFAEEDNAIMYPAGFSNVVAVGASNYAATLTGVGRAYYSNYGNHLDVVAPVGDGSNTPTGNQVLCGVVRSGCTTVNSYKQGFGTSYASPQVAAMAGLLKSSDNSLNTASFREILSSSSDDIGTAGVDDQFGMGLINSNAALINNSVEAVITSPQPDTVINETTSININVNAATEVGNIDRVEFYNDSTLLGTDTTSPYNFVIGATQTQKGVYNLTARVVASNGFEKTSEVADVYIKDQAYIDFIPSQPSGDFNGNNRGDILWGNNQAGEVAYWDGGNQSQGGYLGPTSSKWDYIGKGDFDNNGRTDILWINNENFEVHYWLNGSQNEGRFLGPHSNDWRFLGVGDMDGNGRDDIVWWNLNNEEVHIWDDGVQSQGRFANRQSYDWFSVGIGDLNGNNRDDILWWHTRVDEVGYWDGGRQTVGGGLGSQTKEWTSVAMGDYNGNGRTDMMWVQSSDNILEMWEGGSASSKSTVGTLDNDEFVEYVSDINGDGRDDLILRKPNSASSWNSGQESQEVFLNIQSSDWQIL